MYKQPHKDRDHEINNGYSESSRSVNLERKPPTVNRS